MKLSQSHSLGIASAERNWPVLLALPSEGVQLVWNLVKTQALLPWGSRAFLASDIGSGVPPFLCAPRKPCVYPHFKHL